MGHSDHFSFTSIIPSTSARSENRSGNFLGIFAWVPECLPANAMPETNLWRSIPGLAAYLELYLKHQITFLKYLKLALH
jgi:hypothetical protein